MPTLKSKSRPRQRSRSPRLVERSRSNSNSNSSSSSNSNSSSTSNSNSSSTSNSNSTRPASNRPVSNRPASTRRRRKTPKRSSPTSRRTSQRVIKKPVKKPDFLNQQNIKIRKDTRRIPRIPKVRLKFNMLRTKKPKFIEIKKNEGLLALANTANIFPRAEDIQGQINSYLKRDPEQYNDIALFKFIEFLTTKWKDAQIHNYKVDDDFPITEKIIKKYLVDESYSVSYARTILGNYTTLLRNENREQSTRDYNNVSSKIGFDCLKNFRGDEDQFCFCCGNPIKTKDSNDILTPIEVQCDHVIPVNTMLVTVTTDTVHKDLVFIHSTCNNKKGEMNIWDTYKEIGRKKGIFGNMVGSITDEQENENIKKCQDKFISIITSMKLRPVFDIKSRQSAMTELNNILQYKFKEYFDLYMDAGKAANIIHMMKYQELK